MLPYLICFAVSILLYWCAVRTPQKNFCRLFLFLCVLPPVVLAGLRDEKLGFDWFGYGIDIWKLVNHSDGFSQVLMYYPAIEPGYKFFNYVVSFVSPNCHVFFIFHQLFLMSIAVAVAFVNRKQRLSEIILFFYFFYVYNTSMNIIRQSFALMLCMLAYSLWNSHYRKSSLICLGIGGLFHTSIVFAFFTYFLSIFKKFLRKMLVPILVIAFLIIIYAVDSFTFVLTKLIDLNFFSDHYIGYADQIGDVAVHKTDLFFQIGIALLALLFPRKIKNREIASQICYLALVAITLNMFGSITDVAFRVAHYFVIPIAILMPRIATSYRGNQIACLIFALLVAVRFAYFAFSNGLERTVPYSSVILGF